MTQPINTIRQLGYVVRDLDAAIKYWIEVMNAGPFFLIEDMPLSDQVYRGAPTEAEATIAIGNSGALQIELIYQKNDAPSLYKEWLDAGREGIHHIGFFPEDYFAAIQQYKDLGQGPAYEGTISGLPLAYFDTLDTLGHYTEIWENHEGFTGLFLEIEKAAENWDGKDPVRPLKL